MGEVMEHAIEEPAGGEERAANESGDAPDAQAQQEKIAAAKYGGAMAKHPVAAFNRREKMKRFDSADWMMGKQNGGGGEGQGKNSLLMRANQGKLPQQSSPPKAFPTESP